MATSSFEKEFIVSEKQSEKFVKFMQSNSPVHTVDSYTTKLEKKSKKIKLVDPRKIK